MFKWWREERQRDREMQIEIARLQNDMFEKLASSQQKALEAISVMMTESAKQNAKSADVLASWLEGFKVAEADRQGSTVFRDEDAVQREIENVMGSQTPERDLAQLLRKFDDLPRG